jgi:hypothetical protein
MTVNNPAPCLRFSQCTVNETGKLAVWARTLGMVGLLEMWLATGTWNLTRRPEAVQCEWSTDITGLRWTVMITAWGCEFRREGCDIIGLNNVFTRASIPGAGPKKRRRAKRIGSNGLHVSRDLGTAAVRSKRLRRGAFRNNNTFTWSGPSGVMTAPDNGPKGRLTGWYSQGPTASDKVTWPRWSIEPADSPGVRNLRGGKDYDPGLGRVTTCHTGIR